jgi:WD40 repeat protein
MRVGAFALCLSLLGLLGPATIAFADDVSRQEPTRQELLDPAWIEAQLAGIGIDRLIKLYERDEADGALQLVQNALMLSRPFLREHPAELRSQLQARLLSCDEPEFQVFQILPADRVGARMMRPSLAQAGDAMLAMFPIRRQYHYFSASPDGTLLATPGVSETNTVPIEIHHTIELRSGVNGQLLRVLVENPEYVSTAGFSPDLSRFYGVSQDNMLHAWDVQSGEEQWSAPCAFGLVYHAIAAFSPDERLVAVTTFSPQVVVLDAATGEEVAVLGEPGVEGIGHIAFLDNDTLVGCCYDQTVRHWSVSTGEVIEHIGVYGWQLTGDGTRIVSIDAKYVETEHISYGFEVYDSRTGELQVQTAFDKPLHINSMDIDPAGERLIMVTDRPEKRLLAYSLSTGEQIANVNLLHYFGTHVVATTSDRMLTSGGGCVHVWDLSRQVLTAESLTNGGGVAISANGSTAMTRTYDAIRLWNTATWEQAASFDMESPTRSAAMSDDGSRIIYLSGDEVRMIDVATGQTEVVLKTGDHGSVSSRAFALSGDGLIAAANFEGDKSVLFDVASGELLTSSESEPVISLSYDGSFALIGNRLLDCAAGTETLFEPEHVRHNDMSDDAHLAIASCSFTGNVVWDLATGETLKDAAYETNQVSFLSAVARPVAISGNGRITASCSPTWEVYIYDTRELRPLAIVQADHNSVSSLALNFDGSHLLIGTTEGTWHHYRFDNLPP